jgi:hypothetical protein
MIDEKAAAPAKINQEELARVLAELESNPEDCGFNKMFAHNSMPMNVFVIGVQDK